MLLSIGIIYYLNNVLLIDSTLIDECEESCGFKDHVRGHQEFWEAIQDAFISEGINYKLTERDYDFYPRGRVLYSVKENMFIVYLDRCMIGKQEIIDEIVSRMNLPKDCFKVMPDFHYQCAACNKLYVK
jgi:hypothetical protein